MQIQYTDMKLFFKLRKTNLMERLTLYAKKNKERKKKKTTTKQNYKIPDSKVAKSLHYSILVTMPSHIYIFNSLQRHAF